MSYGYFDEETGEYVITRPDTPTPWINYIGRGEYGGFISNTGGGYSFYRDPRHCRITRYRYNSIPADQPGRYIYLRDMRGGEYWSPTWQPVKKPLDDYECRHGTGYTKVNSAYRNIKSEILYFVPLDDGCELWVLTLQNLGETPRNIRAFTYAEFSFPDAVADQSNLDWTGQIMQGGKQGEVLWASFPRSQAGKYYFASSAPIAGFDTDREKFIGPYRDLSNPIVVESGKPRDSLAPRGNIIASLCHDLNLNPGEKRRVVFVLGQAKNESKAEPIISKYKDLAAVEEAFDALRNDWADYLTPLSVETPDSDMNTMINIWNPIQCHTTLNWSRSASAYQTGLRRGMGTRDSSQDTFGVVHTVPERVRKTLEMLWKLQFVDGHAWHQVFPLTGEGGPGLAGEEPDSPQWFSDDHLWLILGTCHYLRETGDFGFLESEIPYQDGNAAPIWEHIKKAVEFTDAHRGVHGLPRVGYSDWNDTLQVDHGSGKAASVLTAMMFCHATSELVKLCEHLGQEDEANYYKRLREDMATRINKNAWDGEWYVRAYDDEGRAIGSSTENHQQISLNTQTWAIISGVATPERGEKAMEKAHQTLNTQYGFALMGPAYNGYDPRIGGTTTYPPGAKENGGIFCHAHAWAIIAAAMWSRGDRAHNYYQEILPPAHNENSDLRKTEPYVYCQNILGPEHPGFGRGFNSWLTGTAAWAYVAGTQYILGVRPTYSGLKIDPCIPKEWSGFAVKRRFRDTTYEIEVKNPDHVSRGVKQITIDDEPVGGNILPIFDDGGTHHVEVVMGPRKQFQG